MSQVIGRPSRTAKPKRRKTQTSSGDARQSSAAQESKVMVAGKPRGKTLWESEVRADVDVGFAATAFYGALEEILTGWVLGQLPAEEEDVEQAVVTVVDVARLTICVRVSELPL